MRSPANINADGATRWSAIFPGVWIRVFALFAGKVIESIPLAVLAGLLAHVGVNLVNLHHIRELTKQNEILKPRCQS